MAELLTIICTLLMLHLYTINVSSSPSITVSCTVDNDECQLSKWNAFKQCISSASGGDICETPKGNFSNIAISINNLVGNQNKPIIIRSKERYSTVLDGTINLNSTYFKWQKSLQNECIYHTQLNKSLLLWQLFINYEMQTPARFPNGALWKDKTIFNASLALNNGDKKSEIGLMIDFINNSQQISNLNFSVTNSIAILNIFSFQTVSSKVTHHKIGSNQFNYSYLQSWLPGKHKQYNDKRYYLEGLFEFMDEQTEYHLDINTNILYSYTPNCINPNNANEISSIRGKTQSFALNISDSSYINITDLIFFGTGFNIQKSNDITLENNIFSYHGYSKRLLGFTDGPIPSYGNIDNFSVINNTFIGSDAQPIVIKKNDAYFYNNLFEYISYSCVTTYGSEAAPAPISASVLFAKTFIQNTVINYGPYNGYSAGHASLAEMNYFANQSNLQHDGSQIQVGPNNQPNTKLIKNWSYNTLKYGYRFDGCSANSNDDTNCGHNCTISHCVSFNDQSIMIKGDNHTVLNNIGFNATLNNGVNGGDSSKDPAICIRHLSHNWTNNHTITMNNGADEFMVNNSNNGCLYPIVGYASNNIQGKVEPQLVDAENFNFRPKSGSNYAKQGVGPYLVNDTYYWIPGRKTNDPSFPIPKHDGILRYRCHENDKYIELIWRMGYKSAVHIGKIFDDKYNLIEEKEFIDKNNIWEIRDHTILNNPGKYYWSVDSIIDDEKIVHKGKIWKFQLIGQCI